MARSIQDMELTALQIENIGKYPEAALALSEGRPVYMVDRAGDVTQADWYGMDSDCQYLVEKPDREVTAYVNLRVGGYKHDRTFYVHATEQSAREAAGPHEEFYISIAVPVRMMQSTLDEIQIKKGE